MAQSVMQLPGADRLLGMPASGSPAMMPLEAYRRDGSYMLLFDLPGLEPDTIDITLESGVLTVTANRPELDSDEIDWVMRERQSGRFSRRVFLSEDL